MLNKVCTVSLKKCRFSSSFVIVTIISFVIECSQTLGEQARVAVRVSELNPRVYTLGNSHSGLTRGLNRLSDMVVFFLLSCETLVHEDKMMNAKMGNGPVEFTKDGGSTGINTEN